MHYIFVIWSLFMLFNGCNKSTEMDETVIKKTYFKNANISSKISYKNV